MEENQKQQQGFRCSGDCLNCREKSQDRREQWQYCAAQHTYKAMRLVEAMHESLLLMQGTIDELNAKIEAIQNSEAHVYDPTQPSNIADNVGSSVGSNVGSIIAQDGDGADVGPRDSVTL